MFPLYRTATRRVVKSKTKLERVQIQTELPPEFKFRAAAAFRSIGMAAEVEFSANESVIRFYFREVVVTICILLRFYSFPDPDWRHQLFQDRMKVMFSDVCYNPGKFGGSYFRGSQKPNYDGVRFQ
jgi:hypothetical protein